MRRIARIFVLSLFAVAPAAFGQVTISVDAPSTVQIGIGLKYAITVTNTGASGVSGIVITDNLPAGLSATSLSSNCAGTTTIICDIGTLAAGQNGQAAGSTYFSTITLNDGSAIIFQFGLR